MTASKTLFESLVHIGIPADSPDFVGAASAVVRHITGVDGAYACQRAFKDLEQFSKIDTSAQKFRLMLSDISYIHLNLKFFCFNLIKSGMTVRNLHRFKEEFGIDRNDVVLIRKVFKQRGFRKSIKSADYVKSLRKEQINKAAFDSIFEPFNEIYPVLMRHIKSRTYTKLRFISVSSNMEFYDFHMELTCKALQAYIKMVPTDKEQAHILNYLRNTVNNHTTNMIKAHTSQKRQRMVKGASDGFGGFNYEIPVVSENQLFRAFGVDNVSYEAMQGIDHQTEDEKVREGQLSFDMLLRKFGKTPKRRAFIKLISLHEHKGFTGYLRRSELIAEDQDNIDYSEIAGERAYFESVCNFLRVRRSKAQRFMHHIAKVAYPEYFAAENSNGVQGT